MLKNSVLITTIIFDLGGVLLQEPERNLQNVLPAHLINGEDIRIFNRMFEFAALVSRKDCKKNWFMGIESGHQIVQLIAEHIENPAHASFFKSEYEKDVIKHGAKYLLLPAPIASLTYLDMCGFEFVKLCKANGIRLLILSNWDPESFNSIKAKFPEIFSLFNEEDIFIPTIIGYMKPESGCYARVIEMGNLNPKKTLFIDDSEVNARAAISAGLQSIHHKNWDETEKLVF